MAQVPVEIVFSFDTTSSMSVCLGEVRARLQEITERLFTDIPFIRIGILAHGDYVDKNNYVTRWIDLAGKDEQDKLVDFVKNVQRTSGGDWEECYELVLQQSQTVFSWTPGSQRALVMIGDAIPHSPMEAFRQGGKEISWEEEVEKLLKMNVRVHAIQCISNLMNDLMKKANVFWRQLSKAGHGNYLKLEQFATIVDMFMAICFHEAGAEYFQAFEKEIRFREGPGIRHELTRMFDTLRDDDDDGASAKSATSSGYGSLPPLDNPLKTPSKRRRPVSSSDDTLSAKSPAKRARLGEKKTPPSVKRALFPAEDEDDSVKSHPAASRSSLTPRAIRARQRSSTKDLILEKRLRSSTIASSRKMGIIKNKKNSIQKKKTTKKTSKDESHKMKSKLTLLREEVNEENFILKDLSWCPWRQALKETSTETPQQWIQSVHDYNQMLREDFYETFAEDRRGNAVYELAISTGLRRAKHPVHFLVGAGGCTGTHLGHLLLNEQSVINQAHSYLRKGCKVYARKANLQFPLKVSKQSPSNVQELRRLIRNTYDYSWSRVSPRKLVIEGKQL